MNKEVQKDVAAPIPEAPKHKQGQRRRRRGPRQNDARDAARLGGDDVFAPRHLAPPGPVNNDPLTDKCFFPQPGEQFAPTVATEDFFPGTEGLMALATQEYTALVAHAFSVKRSISLSGYCYYAACLTWSRMLDVHAQNQGRLSYDERRFVEGMQKYNPPKVLGAYLAGLGNTEFETGFHTLHLRIKKPEYKEDSAPPYFPGYFGKMKGNARFYASYPCIAVFARRVMQDLIATREYVDDVEWDLPNMFAYPERALTVACQGYAPAQRLDSSTVSTYSLVGVTANAFPFENDSLAVNYQFLNMVQLWIEEVRGVVLSQPVVSPRGSRGQLVWEELVACRGDLWNCDWRGHLATKQSAGPEYAGSTFLYRVIKSYSGTGRQAIEMKLAPFAAVNHAEVLTENLNHLRDAEDDEMLAVTNGVSPVFTLSSRLRTFMSSSTQ